MPIPTNREQFTDSLRKSDGLQLAREFVLADVIHAFPTQDKYADFRAKVTSRLPAEAEAVFVVGSGNWRYSLNPKKLLDEFHKGSDVDVAVVSNELYNTTWETMRTLQRKLWYSLGYQRQRELARNGENVYSGFACPKWLTGHGHQAAYEFKTMLNKLSGPDIGYRDVNMYYFKNETEMIDYYRRGFMNAKRELQR